MTSNIHGVTASNSLIPHEYFTSTPSIHTAKSISAFDVGGIPGYAYINNINGWQFGAFAGIGAVVQTKVYNYADTQRGFLGMAPRVDLKLQAGYNRSEEHTSELQSRPHLVCRLLLEKKKIYKDNRYE